MSLSTNRQVEPESHFRIVHPAQIGQDGVPLVPYREQLVEIRGPSEKIVSTPYTDLQPPVAERVLRPIATIIDLHDPIREFQKLLGSHLTQIRDVP